MKNTINTMVDQLNAFAGEVTRVAREVGRKGSWEARRKYRRGRHLEGFDGFNVNFMASKLTGQVRNIAEASMAGRQRRPVAQKPGGMRGEILQ